MKYQDLPITLKPIFLSDTEEQKRVDEISQILYELYCQHQLKESVHHQLKTQNPIEENFIQ